VSPYGPEEANPADALLGPSVHHPFGTDESGFDIMTRVFYAARIDLSLSALGVGLGLLIGVLLGVVAGFARGLLGELAMRLVDLIQAFPLFILAVALVALSGNHLSNIVWALAFLTTPIFLRLIRSRVLTIREQRYIEAAIALGNPRRRLLVRHVLPNALSPVIVQFGISMGYAILTIAGLAFLGVGVQVPTPEWGSMILIGRNNITTGQWWTVVFPGIWLALAVVGLNLLSEGVERAREVHR
jgi:peptide/nickel transport system permease protein